MTMRKQKLKNKYLIEKSLYSVNYEVLHGVLYSCLEVLWHVHDANSCVALRSLQFKAPNLHVSGHSFYIFHTEKGIDIYLFLQKLK